MTTERPRLTLRQAAAACSVSLSTIRRRREAGAFPHAVRDPVQGWLIPVPDLLAAGLRVNAPAPPEDPPNGQPPAAAVSELRAELEAQRARAERAETEARMLREMLARSDEHLADMRRSLLALTAAPSRAELPQAEALSDAHEQPTERPVSVPEQPRPRWWSRASSARHRRAH